jgi:hypothetical protein
MIIFLNDDRAYLHWVTHHRRGFVLDGRSKPKVGRLVVHRATCAEVKSAASKRIHWTTGAKFKACSLDRSELQTWAENETEASVQHCPICRPDRDQLTAEESSVHLSKLAREIMDYVLDAALIHMEQEHPPYRLTVGDIAACFAKTPGQISAALHQLLDDGLVTATGKMSPGGAIPAKRLVLPAVGALRTLDAFRNESDAFLQAELQKLWPEPSGQQH